MQGQPFTPAGAGNRDEISNRWPHIARYLRVTGSPTTHRIDSDYLSFTSTEDSLPRDQRAAAYEEWADFHEWRLTQRADELAGDRVKRLLVTQWTDSMAYSCRRCAALTRGEDPGEWINQTQRRPDLHAESEAIVADIIAKQNTRRHHAEQQPMAG